MVVALFAPPLEAWIRWVAPFYVLTITFWKTDCVHLASDSAVDQATSSVVLKYYYIKRKVGSGVWPLPVSKAKHG